MRNYRIIVRTWVNATFVPKRLAGCGLPILRMFDRLSGCAYTIFVADVFGRESVGVATRSTMRIDALSMEAVEHALTAAGRVHGNLLARHSDRGSQSVSLKYSTAVAESGIRPRVGTVGDLYDNAIAETVNGLYTTELDHAHDP